MNPLLQVKLRFVNERNTQQVVAKNLRANASTSDDKVYQLIESLRAVKRFYIDSPKVIKNMLIDVNYNDIIAKSNCRPTWEIILPLHGKTAIGGSFAHFEP